MKQKINISTHLSTSLKAVYESFIISQISRGIFDATITNYHNHLRGIAKHIDIDMPFDELSKRHLEAMVVSVRMHTKRKEKRIRLPISLEFSGQLW